MKSAKEADRVVIESPYAGDIERNMRYLRMCMRDSIMRGEAPFASHALYTQPGVLNDDDPDERAMGISLGCVWGAVAARVAVYMDHGISPGMRASIAYYQAVNVPVDYRRIFPASAEDR